MAPATRKPAPPAAPSTFCSFPASIIAARLPAVSAKPNAAPSSNLFSPNKGRRESSRSPGMDLEEAPSSKHQAAGKPQIPNPKLQKNSQTPNPKNAAPDGLR